MKLLILLLLSTSLSAAFAQELITKLPLVKSIPFRECKGITTPELSSCAADEKDARMRAHDRSVAEYKKRYPKIFLHEEKAKDIRFAGACYELSSVGMMCGTGAGMSGVAGIENCVQARHSLLDLFLSKEASAEKLNKIAPPKPHEISVQYDALYRQIRLRYAKNLYDTLEKNKTATQKIYGPGPCSSSAAPGEPEYAAAKDSLNALDSFYQTSGWQAMADCGSISRARGDEGLKDKCESLWLQWAMEYMKELMM